MTSNLGATEINAILKPRLGFAPSGREDQDLRETRDDLQNKISCAGLEAVRRRFTPEFVNRLDTIVVFKPLARTELRQVLEIELQGVQERIFQNLSDPFIFSVTDAGKEFLLREGTNLNYGARHLKRAIDRLLVQPLANLIATDQVRDGDIISVDFSSTSGELVFWKESRNLPQQEEVAPATDEPAPLFNANVAAPVWTMAPQTQLVPV